MNLKLKKGLMLILICTLLLPSIFACGDKKDVATNQNSEDSYSENDVQNEVAEETTEALILPNLPDVQYDGYKFRIINTNPDSVTWLLTQIEAEEETGEVLSDSIYRRNRIIEEKYNIEIEEIVANDPGDAKNKAQKSAQAGSDDYDLVFAYIGGALEMGQKGLMHEITSIPYIDLSKPWWDKDVIADLSITGKLFGIAGDLCFAHYSAVMPIFFNKQMVANLGLEDPYQLVNEGKWTLDKFADMSQNASIDLNGDGVWNQDDQYGFMSLNFLVYPSFMLSAGEKFVQKDADDVPYFAAGSQRFIDVYDKIIDVLTSNNRFFDADAAGNHRYQL